MSGGSEVVLAPRWWRLGVTATVGVLVALVMAASILDGYVRHPSAASVAAATLDIVGVGAVLARRRLPLAVLAVELAVCVVTSALGTETIHNGSVVLAVVALYTFGTLRPPARTVIAAAVTATCVGAVETVSHGDIGPLIPDVTLFTAVTAVSFYVRSHRALMVSYRERAEQAEHEQQLVATQAVAAERVRIARELHDVVAHHVSLLVVQAGGVRETLPADHVTRPVLDSMIEGGRQAMDEMRAMLDALRFAETVDDTTLPGPAPGPARDPQPTSDQIPGLVAGARAAGLPVTLQVEGAARDAAPAASLAAYRIVQEALTNAVRHAPGAFTTVHLRVEPDELVVRVRNGRPPLPPGGAERAGRRHGPAGRGHGLVGMRERAALADGTLTAGPTDDGWEVLARLPLGAPPGGPAGPAGTAPAAPLGGPAGPDWSRVRPAATPT